MLQVVKNGSRVFTVIKCRGVEDAEGWHIHAGMWELEVKGTKAR